MSELAASPEVVRATWRWLAHAAHGVSEVRVIRPGGGILGIGFFDDEEAFVRECARMNAGGNVYVGIQPRPRALLESAPNAVRPLKSGATRKDIEVLTATVIDLDPVRPKDTASTDGELELALATARAAADWCESEGLVRPRIMMSGNGAQLWFALPPTVFEASTRARLEAGLKAFEASVRKRFQTDAVRVDSIHDVSRIIKVVGTVSRKGDGLGDRPHQVSAPLTGVARIEDSALLRRLHEEAPEESPNRDKRVSLPVVGSGAASPARDVGRSSTGQYDWEHPVEMCGPVQRLWDEGAEDRSVAIFNMVRFFAHKGLPLVEITDLVLEYDRRRLGKLDGRDGPAYIRQAYDKVISTLREDGTIAPPCHALQELGHCRVNREPGIRCELHEILVDIQAAIDEVPSEVPIGELPYRLQPIVSAIAECERADQERYLAALEKRFSLDAAELRAAVARAAQWVSPERASMRALLASAAARARSGGSPEPDGPTDTALPTTEDGFEGELFEDFGCYYVLGKRGERKIVSSFTIEPSMRVETEDGEIIFGNAHTDRGAVVGPLRLSLSAFHSKRDLIRQLPSADLQWTGSDNNVQGLLRVLARRPLPHRPGATLLGEYDMGERRVWLGPNCTIGEDGFLDPPPAVYVPSGASLDKRVSYEPTNDAAFLNVARVVFRCLPVVNKPEVIVPVLGWFFATPMKPRLMRAVGSFPLLFVWGTQGSGKSGLCSDVMWPLFGIFDPEPYSATETEFALLKLLSSTRSVPVFIDEYKPYDMNRQRLNTFHRYLRRLYRGESEERGRPDLKVTSYHLQAPLCVAGETRPTEAALLERIITSNPTKTTLVHEPTRKQIFRELRSVPLQLFAPRYIQFCLGRDFGADLELARRATKLLLGERQVPVRIVQNLTAMLLGVNLFEEFAKACGCQLPSDLGAAAAVDAILADLLEAEHGVKNALDYFLEMLGVMAVQGDLRHRVHYAFVDDGHLAVHLESAYDAFRAHCKRIDYEGEIVDMKALRRLVQENQKQGGFVVSHGERVYFDSSARRRAVVIDLARTSGVSAEDFPQRGGEDAQGLRSTYRAYNPWGDPS